MTLLKTLRTKAQETLLSLTDPSHLRTDSTALRSMGGAIARRGGGRWGARSSAPVFPLSGKTHEREAGFTLIEMMIVVAIIGLIMGMVGLNVMKKFDEARVDTTKNQIRQLTLILADFKRQCGNYPTSEQGLDALVRKENAPNCKNWEPFVPNSKLPQDAWSRDFLYSASGDDIEVKSLGSDGKDGGDGTSKDISSKEL
jgi:general secretion pathway protein G